MPTNVARPLTPFIGRAADLRRLGERLAAGDRLITVLGPPGIGKTRLALEFGLERQHDFSADAGGCVWFCDLADARDLHALTAAVARVVAASPDSQVAADAVGPAIAARGRILLLLDNFEQLVSLGSRTIARWLAEAPEAVFVVTSRERLRLAGEAVHEVGPLALPADASRVAIAESPAVQLFVARARAVRADFELDETSASRVAELVRRLDGLPLAIELSAARVGVMDPAQMLERLSERFALLSAGSRDVAPRHATLRAALESSWDLLTQDEQRALAASSVFRGGFSLEAAEAVLGPMGTALLDVLQALHDKSLLRSYEAGEEIGERRFGLYESIRDFAQEKLEGSGRTREVEERHAAFFLPAAERWAEGAFRHPGMESIERLSLEQENIVAVHRRALEQGAASPAAVARALRAGLALGRLLMTRGPVSLLVTLLEEPFAAPAANGVVPELRSRALAMRGLARGMVGEHRGARRDNSDALALAQASKDPELEALALVSLASSDHEQGSLDEARSLYARALDLARKAKDAALEGRIRSNLGDLEKLEGNLAEAEEHLAAALRIARDVGDLEGQAVTLSQLGNFDLAAGRLSQARERLEESVAINRRLGRARNEGVTLVSLAVVEQEDGHFAQARTHLERAAGILRGSGGRGHRRFEGLCLSTLGNLEQEQGRLAEARERYRAAIAILHGVGDEPYEAYAVACLATLDASEGRIEEASRAFDHTQAVLGRHASHVANAAAEVHRGHLDLALARKSEAQGDSSAAIGHREAARRRIRAAQAGGGAAGSAAQRADEVRFALRMLRRALRQDDPDAADEATSDPRAPPNALLVGPEAIYFHPPGRSRVTLDRHGPIRRLLARLVAHRLECPGGSLSRDQLLEAGWPGEPMLRSAGAARVYWAVASLRKLGLRGILIRREAGYLIDPATPVLRLPTNE